MRLQPRRFAAVAAVVGISSLVACIPKSPFAPDGFHQPTYEYVVGYDDPALRVVISKDWVVDNFIAENDHVFRSPKKGSAYRRETTIELPSGQTLKPEIDLYDLRLVHQRSGAVIWVRTIPTSPAEAGRDLAVVAADYAEGLSGTGFFASDIGPLKVTAKQFATRIVASSGGTVWGNDAFDATLEIANLDQLRLDPKSRSAMVRVVFARTKYEFEADRATGTKLPVRLMIGYVNSPDRFADQMTDFERFLAHFDAKFSTTSAAAPSGSVTSSVPSSR